jgi:hypothetical protein
VPVGLLDDPHAARTSAQLAAASAIDKLLQHLRFTALPLSVEHPRG